MLVTYKNRFYQGLCLRMIITKTCNIKCIPIISHFSITPICIRDTGFHRSCIKFISHQNLFFMQSISKYLMSTHLHKALGCTGLFLFFFFSYPVVNTDSKLNLNSFYELLVCLCFPPSDEPGSLGNFNE